jgi:RimJ/RimL family protein N-acetyltransferase
VDLRTDRLLLRRPRESHAADALALLTDPDVARWNPAPAVVDEATAVRWCLSGADWSSGDHATGHAVDVDTGRLVANLSVFAIDREHATARVAYRVVPWSRRLGYGRESLDAVSSWAFAVLDLARIQLEHAVDNVGSCRVATSCGYRLEGTLRSAFVDGTGVRHDEHVHGRLASEVLG